MKPFLPVLTYQKIGNPPINSHLKKEWVSPHRLEKMLAFLTKRTYTFITPADLQKPLPAKPVLLTFMGGYQTHYTHVFPILKKYNVRATLFVATDALGTYNQWQNPYQEPWQNTLTPAQLKEMYKSGLLCVGTLGLTGNNLLMCENPHLAREEILESIHRLKMLHKIDACAVGFWPGIKDKNLARTQEICAELNLPVITSAKGTNASCETKFLRIRYPNWISRYLYL